MEIYSTTFDLTDTELKSFNPVWSEQRFYKFLHSDDSNSLVLDPWVTNGFLFGGFYLYNQKWLI